MKMSRSGQKTRSDESFNKERNMSYRLTKKRKYEDSSDSDADHTEAQSAAPKETKEKWKVIHEELQNIKDELKKKDEELKKTKDELASFKNRVAADVSLSIKTGKTESLNSPISKTRMVEMYQKFKLLRWPKIKDQLKSCKKMNPKKTEALIQKTFREAAEEMEMKKEAIREVFDLLEPNSGLTSQKIQEYKQLAIQNHQMSLYNSNKGDLVKTRLSELGLEYPEEVLENLRPLVCECYWLGCLLALNTPALQLDWENHTGSMDPWDIFPRNMKSSDM
ncbi:uncharacterized protein KZ484_015746 isoform 2-T2 [Pholidichthys leucotaenia]